MALPAPSGTGCDRKLEGHLIAVQPSLGACRADPGGNACRAPIKELKTPYLIGHRQALPQTRGWVAAWTARPTVYAVAARTTAHVVAAVNFAARIICAWSVEGFIHLPQH